MTVVKTYLILLYNQTRAFPIMKGKQVDQLYFCLTTCAFVLVHTNWNSVTMSKQLTKERLCYFNSYLYFIKKSRPACKLTSKEANQFTGIC